MEKLRSFWQKNRDILLYLIFGGLTTLVNYLIYIPLYQCFGVSGAVSNITAWVGAVVFAFFTNKPIVFRSHDWSAAVVLPEFGKFIGSRVFSGVVETGWIWLTVDFLRWNSIAMKLLASIVVIVINYAASKWLVFSSESKK